jgi:NAD(P)-dependent dehydrogenase (short-subunit alcohol dehydrogenase family)
VGEPGEAFYAASKAALARYTEALRHEVWHLGITVCLIEPGVFMTNVLDAATNAEHLIGDYNVARESARRTLHEGLHRGEDPRKFAELVLAIAESAHPRRRYGVGPQARWLPLLTSLVPQRLFDRILRRSFGLPKRPT